MSTIKRQKLNYFGHVIIIAASAVYGYGHDPRKNIGASKKRKTKNATHYLIILQLGLVFLGLDRLLVHVSDHRAVVLSCPCT